MGANTAAQSAVTDPSFQVNEGSPGSTGLVDPADDRAIPVSHKVPDMEAGCAGVGVVCGLTHGYACLFALECQGKVFPLRPEARFAADAELGANRIGDIT